MSQGRFKHLHSFHQDNICKLSDWLSVCSCSVYVISTRNVTQCICPLLGSGILQPALIYLRWKILNWVFKFLLRKILSTFFRQCFFFLCIFLHALVCSYDLNPIRLNALMFKISFRKKSTASIQKTCIVSRYFTFDQHMMFKSFLCPFFNSEQSKRQSNPSHFISYTFSTNDGIFGKSEKIECIPSVLTRVRNMKKKP